MKRIVSCDAHFTQGQTHDVCEDYATSSKNNLFPFVIISDGCSSSTDTDLGARLLTLSAKALMKNFWGEKLNSTAIVHNALAIVRASGTDQKCLDATLLVAQCIGNILRATCFGDGIMVFRTRHSDVFEVHVVSYSCNAPYYLSYLANPDDRALFITLEQQRVIDIYMYNPTADGLASLTLLSTHVEYITDGSSIEVVVEKPVAEWDMVVIGSDGIESFMIPSSNELEARVSASFVSILRQFLGFPNTNGSFVTRRMKKALKAFVKNDCIPSDDVSFGAVYIGAEQDDAQTEENDE